MTRSPILSNHASGVYSPRRAGVKWIVDPFAGARRGILRFAGAACALLISQITSCVAEPTWQPALHAAAPTGVWYSVELAAESPAGMEKTLERDFANVARMGLDTVLIKHCDPRDIRTVLDAAARHRLGLILSDPVAVRYVRTGWRSQGWFAPPGVVPRRPSVAARYIGHVVDAVTLERAERLAQVARVADPPLSLVVEVDASLAKNLTSGTFNYVLWRGDADDESPVARGGARGSQTIECRHGDDDDSTATRAWLASFHAGLARGWTDGVVFDLYRALPHSGRGIVASEAPLSPERAALIRRIVDRTRTWRERLTHLSVRHREMLRVGGTEVRATILADQTHQCLLLINPSTTRFARGDATISASVARTSFERAVSVPTAEKNMVRPVHPVRAGKLVIPIALAPGEAELFELF